MLCACVPGVCPADGRRFDDLLRSLTDSRRSLLGGSLAALAGLLGMATVEAKKKKKKKPCKKKCSDGCCTKKFGKCIKEAQQTPTQCGTDGEICRNNCGGSGSCKDECTTCCAGDECVDSGQQSNEQCGIGGQDCFACPPGQACNAPGPGCCARKGEECGSNGVACCPTSVGVYACEDNRCCAPNHSPLCTEDSDCCDEEDVCNDGFCGRPQGAACEPGATWCVPGLDCNPTTLTCGPQDCTTPCAEQGQCESHVCFGQLYCCDPSDIAVCNVPELLCECIVEGSFCASP
jgi:hypothetical protein